MRGQRSIICCALLTALATSGAACKQSGGPSEGGAGGELFVCTVKAPTACPDQAPRFAEVAPIIEERCVPCHYGMPEGPWPLREYHQVADWFDVVRADILNCSMPPPDAGVPMTDDEKVAILTWIQCGLAE